MDKYETASARDPRLRKLPMLSSGEKQNRCCRCVGTATRATTGETYTQNPLLNTADREPNQLASPVGNL